MQRIVLIAGFESFNVDLYRQAAIAATDRCPELEIRVFSDRDITTKPAELETALQDAQVFFGSLLFDYDQVLWLCDRIQHIPIRLVFESALELMSLTKLGESLPLVTSPRGCPSRLNLFSTNSVRGEKKTDWLGISAF